MDGAGGDAQIVAFRKPARKGGGGGRRKQRSSAPLSSSASDDAADVASGSSVAAMQQLQKMRGRGRGLDPTKAIAQASAASDIAAAAAAVAVAEPKGLDRGGLLNAAFERVEEVNPLKVQMDTFIESKMAARHGGPALPEAAEKTDEQRLYETPHHLQIHASQARETELSGVSDLREVELPIEHKLRNIEETEKVKQAMLARQPAAPQPARSHAYFQGAGAVRRATHGGAASDDKVLERFKKQRR